MSSKDLARKLGFLKKVKKIRTNAEQVFKYFVVIDLESTCWEKTSGISFVPEIIEFPAVLLNASTGKVEAQFLQYVMPIENPSLSEFCKNFTGITQDKVEEGMPLAPCLATFNNWLRTLMSSKNLTFGLDGQPSTSSTCSFMTWTDWDLGICLHNECQRKAIMKSVIFNEWIDLKLCYKTFYGEKPHGLRGALQDRGLAFQGREHSGMDDALNTAKLAFQMIEDGAVLQTTSYMMGGKIVHAKCSTSQ